MIEFDIEIDRDLGRYEPRTIHLKLKKLKGKGEAVEGELVSVEMDREGILRLEEMPSDSGEPILVFDVYVEDEVQSRSDFLDQIEEPVIATFKQRPKDDPEAEPVSEQVQFNIPDPTGRIHWQNADDASTKDTTLELDADGESEMTLEVWIDMWDPVRRELRYDPDKVEFTHWTGPQFSPQIFGPHPEDLPHVVAGPGNNRDHSRWQSKAPLPNPERFPNKIPPIDDWIRVRAWPKGRIDRQPYAIDAHERMIGEKKVPVRLVAPKIVVRIIEPELPIPADGLEHELRLQAVKERSGTPVERAKLSLELDETHHGYRGGQVQPTAVDLTKDDNGEFTLTYTAPELTYEPEKSFTEELVAYRGTGDDRVELNRMDVHLSPKIEARIEAEKIALEFEPYEFTIDPGLAPKEIRGKVRTEVLNRYPEIVKGSDTVYSDVRKFDTAYADVKIFTGPGASTQLPGEIKTDEFGDYVWKLPELEEGLAKAPPERAIKELDPELEYPKGRFDDDSKTIIEFYEEKMSGYAPWHLYDDPLSRNLRNQRLLLGEQLSTKQTEFAPEALAGTHLLRAGATFGNMYDILYQEQFAKVGRAVSTLFAETVGYLINTHDVGDWLGRGAGWVAKQFEELGQGFVWVLRAATHRVSPYLVVVSGMIDDVSPYVQRHLRGTLGEALERVGSMFSNLGRGLTTQLDSGQGVADTIVAFIKTIVDAFVAIIHGLWTLFLTVVYTGGRAISNVAGGLGRRAIHWTDETWEAVKPMFAHFTKELPTEDHALGGVFAMGKYLEQVFAYLVNELAGGFVGLLGDVRAAVPINTDWLRARMNPMGISARHTLNGLRTDITQFRVPENHQPPIDRFTRSAVGLNQYYGNFGRAMADVQWYATVIDAIILAGEALVTIVSLLGSGGLLTPGVLATFKKIEVGFAAVKVAVLGVVPFTFHLTSMVTIPVYYGLEVAALSKAR